MRWTSLLCALCLCCNEALAAPVAGLFEATAPVTDRTDAARRAAARTALGLVLIKVTGDRNGARAPATATIRQNAEHYVQQYLYQRAASNPAPSPQPGPPSDATPDGLSIHFQFDSNLLADALRAAGFPTWGHERPATLVWLLLQPLGGEAVLLGVEDDMPALQAGRAQGEARGVPVILPLLDLEDRMLIRPDDVRRGELRGVAQGSARYGAEAVLVGDVRESTPGLWQGQWYLLSNDEPAIWNTMSEDPALLVDEAVNLTADALARRFAGAGSQTKDSGEVTITQVVSVRDYARTLAYLESLETVAGLEVIGVTRDRITLRLAVHGSFSDLARTVMLSHVLRPAAAEPGVFQLIPE